MYFVEQECLILKRGAMHGAFKGTSADFDHFLCVAFNKTSCLRNTSDDMGSCEKVNFLFFILLFK